MYPIVYLKCGGFVSIQASTMHFCTPRRDHGPYTHWEVGLVRDCTREAVALLTTYDGDRAPYVPTEVVRAFIEACGGLARPVDHPALAEEPCYTT